MNYINTDEFPQIAYHKEGNGPAVVLIHGFPSKGVLWREIIPVLSKHFTVIAPDLPGSGESKTIGENVTMDQLADSVKLILDKEGIKKAVIAGHSMGGYTTLAFADNYPDMVQGIALVHSSAVADDEEKKKTRAKSVEILKKGGKDTFIRQMVPNLFADEGKHLPALVAQQTEEGLQQDTEGMIGFYTAMMNRPDRMHVIKNTSRPVQYIIGKKDNLMPFNKLLQQSYAANINFVSLYDDVGHMSMLEDPDRLIADLKEFVIFCNR